MQKTEISGIYKVSEGILVNKDNDALMKYRAKREAVHQTQDRLNNVEAKVNTLAQDIEEIKTLLRKLVRE